MTRRIYHIDPAGGDDTNDGLSPARPVKSHAERDICPGDTVLFKRGSVIRGMLHTQSGAEGAPVTYGAYGEGENPTFLGSVAVGDPDRWAEEKPCLWRYDGGFPSEVCNLIFNHGESCGNLRWQLDDLSEPGEWHYTGIGRSSDAEANREADAEAGSLYLFSTDNPAKVYSSIECALWGDRRLVGGRNHVVLEDLSFRNAGVHGYQEVHTQQITIRRCDFRFIGGAVWNRERRIRFGNAIEFWDGASDILVEACRFDNIYDSGVTHQGGETRNIPEGLVFRNNLFVDCGMAAYECREPSREVYFEHNTCINAGGGFSMQGEAPPRQSEIYPQPVGHHVFIWRIDPDTQPGRVTIRHNLFVEAPYGSAIYSIIDSADERRFVLDGNGYSQTTGTHLIHFGGQSYRPEEFGRYQAESGQDAESRIIEPDFADAASGDFRLRKDSPFYALGMQKWEG
jgi:hypothetical protein